MHSFKLGPLGGVWILRQVLNFMGAEILQKEDRFLSRTQITYDSNPDPQ